MAVALMQFDFNFGDLMRWLEGEHTNAHRGWTEVADAINAVRSIPMPSEEYPDIDFDRAFRICAEGVPLKGDYECSFDGYVNATRTITTRVSRWRYRPFGKNFRRKKLRVSTWPSHDFFGDLFRAFTWPFLCGYGRRTKVDCALIRLQQSRHLMMGLPTTAFHLLVHQVARMSVQHCAMPMHSPGILPTFGTCASIILTLTFFNTVTMSMQPSTGHFIILMPWLFLLPSLRSSWHSQLGLSLGPETHRPSSAFCLTHGRMWLRILSTGRMTSRKT